MKTGVVKNYMNANGYGQGAYKWMEIFPINSTNMYKSRLNLTDTIIYPI